MNVGELISLLLAQIRLAPECINFPVYFDTEAQKFDCHHVPIDTVETIFEDREGTDAVILHENHPHRSET